MKELKYRLSMLLTVLSVLVLFAGIMSLIYSSLFWNYMYTNDKLNQSVDDKKIESLITTTRIIGGIMTGAAAISIGPIAKFRQKARTERKFDEFGRSKEMGSYEKLSVKNKLDQRRLDGWIKAMDVAENYDQKLAENLDKIGNKKEDMINKIAKDTFDKKEKNLENFEKTVEDISKGIPSRIDRIKAGIKQAAEAVMGKDYVNHLSEEKMADKATKDLQKAKEGLTKADKMAGLSAKAKITYVKTWAKAQEAKEALMEKYVSFRAKMAEKAVGKIKNPKVMDIKDKIAEVSKNNDITRQDAKDSLLKGEGTKNVSDKMKDMGPVK